MEQNNKSQAYIEVEENLLLLHCMEENLRILSAGVDRDYPSLGSALYGVVLIIEDNLTQVDEKLRLYDKRNRNKNDEV